MTEEKKEAAPMPSPAPRCGLSVTEFQECDRRRGHPGPHYSDPVYERVRAAEFVHEPGCISAASNPECRTSGCTTRLRPEDSTRSSGAAPDDVVRAAIVEAAHRWVRDMRACHFCDYGSPDDDGGDKGHDDECPFMAAECWREESKARALAFAKAVPFTRDPQVKP